MPDTFVVNRAGQVVSHTRDRSRSLRNIYGYRGQVAVVYTGDPHDVQAPRRTNPVESAARARLVAYRESLTLCVNCRIDERGHQWDSWSDEPLEPEACDEYTKPAPLVLK